MRRVLLAFALAMGTGWGNQARTGDEIFTEKQNRPRLYLSTKSQARTVAPANKGTFTDPATKDEFWPALECTNPECPNRGGSEPYLFTTFDVSAHNGCPACAKTRRLRSESPEDKARYLGFVRPYELPDVRKQLERLNEEYKRSVKDEARKRQ